MDNKKKNRIEPWDDSVYGTGKTEPPKNNSAMVTLLMIVIIFLSGIISGLSFMNIRLFQQLQQAQQPKETIPMAFSSLESASDDHILEANETPSEVNIAGLGLWGEFISTFDQHYFSWPAGLLITEVEDHSLAQSLGLKPGDILTAINGEPITPEQDINTMFFSGHRKSISLTIHRDSQEIILKEK